MLIGLSGLAGSGKSEVAAILVNEFGFTRVKFADPLKNMLRTLMRDMGYCEDDIERHVEGDLKEAIIPEIGVTMRHLMVTLGTEWGRDAVHPDLWTRLWAASADNHTDVVVDDVRFVNEVDLIRGRGGKIWRIERTGLVAGDHVSEQLAVEPDVIGFNDGTLEELRAKVRSVMAFAADDCA